MSVSHDLGKSGECLAREYLEGIGYKCLEQNWRQGHLELDLIMRQGGCLVFVEVKTRSNSLYGMPESFVNRSKQQHMIMAAHAYIRRFDPKAEARFDIVAIIQHGGQTQIKHLPRAFYPILR